MKELKINPELRDFIPPLSGEEKKQLEDSLLKYGYKGAPIYIWHDYIVDGHNRYELCRKHKIEYPVEELLLGDNATIIDVMEWMINTQLGRRNLPPQQRIAVWDKFRRLVEKENREKKSQKIASSNSKRNLNVVQLDSIESTDNKDTSYYTRQQIAKKANVGSGTIARYDKVMSSGNEDIKKKMESGELTINAAYEKVRENEKKKENDNTEQTISLPKTYQEAAKLFGGTQQGHLPNRKKEESIEDGFTNEQLVDALISTKTPVNVLDSIVPKQEFDIMTHTLLENIKSCDYRIFDLHEVYTKMEKEDLDYAIGKFDSVIEEIMKLEEKLKVNVKENK